MLINLVAMHYMILLLSIPSAMSLRTAISCGLCLSMTTFPDALEVFAQISTRKQNPQMSDNICQYKAALLFSPCPNPENSTQDLPIALLLCYLKQVSTTPDWSSFCSRGAWLQGTSANSNFCLPVLSRLFGEAISDSSGRHSRRGAELLPPSPSFLQSHCPINSFSCQPSFMQKTLGLGPARGAFLVFSWDSRHLLCLGSNPPLPARHIPAALEQLWVLGAHTCTLLIVRSRGFSQRSGTGGMRAVNVSCRSGHLASAVICRQVNTPRVIQPQTPPSS